MLLSKSTVHPSNEWKNIPVGYFGNFMDPLLEEIVKGRQQNLGEGGLKAGKISIYLNFKFSYQYYSTLCQIKNEFHFYIVCWTCACNMQLQLNTFYVLWIFLFFFWRFIYLQLRKLKSPMAHVELRVTLYSLLLSVTHHDTDATAARAIDRWVDWHYYCSKYRARFSQHCALMTTTISSPLSSSW